MRAEKLRCRPVPKAEFEYDLRLYVAGFTPRSAAALHNIETLCEKHIAGRYRVQVIDLLVNPQLAKSDEILAVPTLVRKLPIPIRKFVGNLADSSRILAGLNIRPVEGAFFSAERGKAYAC